MKGTCYQSYDVMCLYSSRTLYSCSYAPKSTNSLCADGPVPIDVLDTLRGIPSYHYRLELPSTRGQYVHNLNFVLANESHRTNPSLELLVGAFVMPISARTCTGNVTYIPSVKAGVGRSDEAGLSRMYMKEYDMVA